MDVDVAIIGGGQAGVPLARSLAEAGQQVALIERVHLGGSCVNFGCTPSKALIASAQVAYEARNGERWGIRIPTVDVDFGAVMDRARSMVAAAKTSLDDSIEQAANPCLIRAHGRLAGREEGRFVVESDAGRVRARHVVLDTGTRSLLPDIDGLGTVPLLTAENWIDMTVLPERLIVIGGSYLALEFGQAFSRLGSKVVVLQSGSALAEREDPDVSDAIAGFLEAEGLQIRLDVEIDRVEPIEGGVRVHVDGGVLDGTHLLVATGRRPNTDDLGLETLGVATDQHGMIEVDERLATTVAGVWAAGDIRGGPAFTHTAYADSKVVHDQIVGDGRMTTERIVPYAMFLDPELGRVGMTETEARKAGHAIRIGRKDMSTSGKAKEVGQTAGFIKVVIDAETDRFLGAACLCHNGSEVVQVFIALMNAGAGARTIMNSVVIHPTIGEAAKNAVVAAYP
jgi:pyruvate/2-oxoglutarate dehydrogenase complex dihydrolipoamide dehydrogenase (E3) component